MGGEPARRRQVALFFLAVLLLNAPVLTVVDRLTLSSGVPLTPLFLFVGWLGVILLGALNIRPPRG